MTSFQPYQIIKIGCQSTADMWLWRQWNYSIFVNNFEEGVLKVDGRPPERVWACLGTTQKFGGDGDDLSKVSDGGPWWPQRLLSSTRQKTLDVEWSKLESRSVCRSAEHMSERGGLDRGHFLGQLAHWAALPRGVSVFQPFSFPIICINWENSAIFFPI